MADGIQLTGSLTRTIGGLGGALYAMGTIPALVGWKGMATAAIIGVGATVGAVLLGGIAGSIGGMLIGAAFRAPKGGAILGYLLGTALAIPTTYDFVEDTVINGFQPEHSEEQKIKAPESSSKIEDNNNKLGALTVKGDYNLMASVITAVEQDNVKALTFKQAAPTPKFG